MSIWLIVALAAAPGLVGIANLHAGAFIVGSALGIISALIALLLWWPLGLILWICSWLYAAYVINSEQKRKLEERRHREIILALERGQKPPPAA